MPNNTVSECKAMIFKNMIKNYIEWKYFTILNMVSDLPAKRAIWMKKANTFRNYSGLVFNIIF